MMMDSLHSFLLSIANLAEGHHGTSKYFDKKYVRVHGKEPSLTNCQRRHFLMAVISSDIGELKKREPWHAPCVIEGRKKKQTPGRARQ